MDRHNVVYKYNGILLSHQKEWHSYICYDNDELEDIILNEISQKQKGDIFYDSTYMKYWEQTFREEVDYWFSGVEVGDMKSYCILVI